MPRIFRRKTITPETLALRAAKRASGKLTVTSGVYIPVLLNVISILMFLRFGMIIGDIGVIGILGLLTTAYTISVLTTLSLSAIASNGEIKGGGAYYLISRTLGPEFGGSIGTLFFASLVLSTCLNITGLVSALSSTGWIPDDSDFWGTYAVQTAVLVGCMAVSLAGMDWFKRASRILVGSMVLAVAMVAWSTVHRRPFRNEEAGIVFTGPRWATLRGNAWPETWDLSTFRDLFGILFPATSGILAGASMSGDLRTPGKSIPRGTLWATGTTLLIYTLVILCLGCSVPRDTLKNTPNILAETNLVPGVILLGECTVTLFSSLMGVVGSANLLQAISRDRLMPFLGPFANPPIPGKPVRRPLEATLVVYFIAQIALLAPLNTIASWISSGFQMTFLILNFACVLLSVASAPNFRPSFTWFSWRTALAGTMLCTFAMLFVDSGAAGVAVVTAVVIFVIVHFEAPMMRWGDVSQGIIYHQVRKYLLRLRPEHIKFWRAQVLLLVRDPRRQRGLIAFCNQVKKGGLYILGHIVVTSDFVSGVAEVRRRQRAGEQLVRDMDVKGFVQMSIATCLQWGIRSLVVSSGLGGMRPNVVVLGFHEESKGKNIPGKAEGSGSNWGAGPGEGMSEMEYVTILEDLALQLRINVVVARGFDAGMEQDTEEQEKGFIDLWPVQIEGSVEADGQSIQTTNFDTYTLILQLGHILSLTTPYKHRKCLRVHLFVEYEADVASECLRIKALLDKLRIKASYHVYCLATADLPSYQLLVNGQTDDPATSYRVDKVIGNADWWLEVKRGRRVGRTRRGSMVGGVPGVFSSGGLVWDGLEEMVDIAEESDEEVFVDALDADDFDESESELEEEETDLLRRALPTYGSTATSAVAGVPRVKSAPRFTSHPIPETLTNVDAQRTITFASFSSSSSLSVSASSAVLGKFNPDYTVQHLPLSFDTLPARAQCLVINEMMRRYSGEASVVFSTLPVPMEGTGGDQEGSKGYVGDLEVLTRGVGRVVLVGGREMSVTVSL